jgi:predicted dinucleotide-binding enzyme
VLCGDDAAAKRTVGALARDAGFEPVDAGPLRTARLVEPFGLLVGQLAYTQGLGPALGYRLVRPDATGGDR